MSDIQSPDPTATSPSPPPPAGPGGNDEDPRVAQFRDEIDQLRLKGSSAQAERWLMYLGAAMGVIGVVLAIVGATQVVNAGDSPADQRAYMATGPMLGLVLVVAGAALFLRYSMGRYLRFWLIRLVYEGRSDADRVSAAIDRAAGPIDDVVAPPPVLATPPPAPPAAPTAPPQL